MLMVQDGCPSSIQHISIQHISIQHQGEQGRKEGRKAWPFLFKKGFLKVPYDRVIPSNKRGEEIWSLFYKAMCRNEIGILLLVGEEGMDIEVQTAPDQFSAFYPLITSPFHLRPLRYLAKMAPIPSNPPTKRRSLVLHHLNLG